MAFIKDLKEQVKDISVGFFHLVEENHAVGFSFDFVGEKTAFFETDVAGRCTDKPRHRMLSP